MSLRFLTVDDAEWGEFLGGVRHDFYHLPSYARLSAPFDGGRPEAVLFRQGSRYFFLPYVVRPLSQLRWLGSEGDELFDIVSPYGYPGPLASPDSRFVTDAIGQWRAAMRDRGAVSGFIRLHPLIEADHEALAAHGELVSRGRTVSIDLTLSPDEMWSQTSQTHRNEISKARRAGLTALMDSRLVNMPTFLAMYYETMDRAAASQYYYFREGYFSELRDALGDSLSLCLVRDPEGQVLCGGLFTECCGIVQYHLSATFSAALRQHPAKLMLDYVRKWAKERGNTVMHLGGGMGAREDSLFSFKSRFSPRRHAFFTWQMRLLPDVYEKLESRRRSMANGAVESSYFPVYRA
ncbi:MAG: GNAT family N-acetyltransferase [Planctomycetia bacterium]|nr:GNAT family N-acetyltransferase [Planctomycetia bacterium]